MVTIDFIWMRRVCVYVCVRANSSLHFYPFFERKHIHNRNLICFIRIFHSAIVCYKDIETLYPFCIRSNQFETMACFAICFIVVYNNRVEVSGRNETVLHRTVSASTMENCNCGLSPHRHVNATKFNALE